MNKPFQFLSVIAVAAIVALGAVRVSPNSRRQDATISSQQPVYDRVVRTKTLRCGYVVFPPTIIKDPNTGAMSGILYDAIEKAAAKIGIKVEWATEVNWGDYLTALQYNHADMICAASWNNTPEEWLQTESIGPLFYSGIGVWVRANDDRFTGHIDRINDPNVTIASIDGMIPGRIAAVDFPKAKVISLPQITDYTFNLMNVVNGKADVTFVENSQGMAFNEKNPSVLKNIAAENPIRIYPDVFLAPKGEQKLKNTFDRIFQDMINNGEMEQIIRKYEKYPGSFYRVAKPYQAR
ncbi:MAG: transporter substrate-binding domain-containing protein [Alphaproteobacteria bacterium]|nr:transporter substrate-binding domain-containing protein [Alphaproteobacteria bacterium]